MKRWIIILGIIAVAAAVVGGVLWFRSRQGDSDQPEVLRTAQAQRMDLEITIPASGNVTASERRILNFDRSGKVAAVNVATNERVEAGQTLASLDSEDLERQVARTRLALEQAEIDLEEAQQEPDPEDVEAAQIAVQAAAKAMEVARIGTQTARADADQLVLQAVRKREQAWVAIGEAPSDQKDEREEAYQDALTEEQLAKLNAQRLMQQAETEYASAQTRHRQAVENLETLQSGPDEDQIKLLELQKDQAALNLTQAERELSKAVLKAPFAGLIAEVEVQEDERISPGDPAFTLVDDSEYSISVTVDEIDIGGIEVDQPVNITLDAYPDSPLDGTIERIAPEATEIGGLTSYRVDVLITDRNGVDLYDGMTASVSILTRRIEEVLAVPNWAIRSDQETGEIFTYQIINGSPVRTEIEIGERNDEFTEVRSGLAEGDKVALVAEERVDFSQGPPASFQN